MCAVTAAILNCQCFTVADGTPPSPIHIIVARKTDFGGTRQVGGMRQQKDESLSCRRPWLFPDWTWNLTSTGRKFIQNCDYVHKFTDDLIDERYELLVSSGRTRKGGCSSKLTSAVLLYSACTTRTHTHTSPLTGPLNILRFGCYSSDHFNLKQIT